MESSTSVSYGKGKALRGMYVKLTLEFMVREMNSDCIDVTMSRLLE